MNRTQLTVAMIVAATASTLLPHPPNFTPMAAIALFAGARFRDKRAAFGFPFAVLFLRDVWLGLHALMPAVYGAFALTVLLGFALREKEGALRVAGASVAGSILFFAVTNFAVWAQLGTYLPTLEGLAACYAAGLPHFKNTLLGDLMYSTLLFGLAWIAQRRLATAEVAP